MADDAQRDRKDRIPGETPMTGAQASYLKSLGEEAHKPIPKKKLTKEEAAELIDDIQEETGIGTDLG